MGYQGARHSRHGAGARQAPSPSADDPGETDRSAAPGQLIGPGTGGYRVLETGRGAGSGPQQVLGSGSGPQPTLDRTPVRGFPPPVPGYQQPPTPPDGFSAWHTPGAPPAGQDAGYAAGGALVSAAGIRDTLLAAAAAGREVTQYTSNEVKQALVGYGAATKEQVQRMVAQVLGLGAVDGPPDVADALALAICHLTTVPLRRAVDAAIGSGT